MVLYQAFGQFFIMGDKMTIRFTLAEKWQDKWFRELNPVEKLLFLYMCDNCNIAGIWEVDLEQVAFSIGQAAEPIIDAFEGLTRGYESLDGTHIWLKNFLKHQRNLPLNPSNAAHATIINLLLPHKDLSENILQLLSTDEIKGLTRGLQAPISISIGKSKGRSISKSKGEKPKKKYLDFVYLTNAEYRKLIDKFGEAEAKNKIDCLNNGIGSKGYTYKSHYHAILSWDRKNGKDRRPQSAGKTGRSTPIYDETYIR